MRHRGGGKGYKCNTRIHWPRMKRTNRILVGSIWSNRKGYEGRAREFKGVCTNGKVQPETGAGRKGSKMRETESCRVFKITTRRKNWTNLAGGTPAWGSRDIKKTRDRKKEKRGGERGARMHKKNLRQKRGITQEETTAKVGGRFGRRHGRGRSPTPFGNPTSRVGGGTGGGVRGERVFRN